MNPISTYSRPCSRTWVNEAIRKIEADFNRSADTHLFALESPAFPGVPLYLKDESTHPTGSLKHRLARSLFLYGLCNGWIKEGTTLIEASSGSTAVSEAYFAKMLGLPFIAVMPKGTSPEKLLQIQFYGGRCHLVDSPSDVYSESRRLAAESNGHFMDQFTYAERATDWRGNNNIAESIFAQMNREKYPLPAWVVVGAGTGGTSATLGRYVRYQMHPTKIAVVDPENSAFFEAYEKDDCSVQCSGASKIEGIGRPRCEPSFIPSVVDRAIRVKDSHSIAAMRWLERVIGKKCGGSTGTNLWGALILMSEMKARGEKGSVVTLICDGGERYSQTYYNDAWVKQQGWDLAGPTRQIEQVWEQGTGL